MTRIPITLLCIVLSGCDKIEYPWDIMKPLVDENPRDASFVTTDSIETLQEYRF